MFIPSAQLNALTAQRDNTVHNTNKIHGWRLLEKIRDVKVNEWVVEPSKHLALVGLGTNRTIEGVVSWPRYDETKSILVDRRAGEGTL